MIYCKLLFTFLLIFITISINSGLKVEEIIGGYPAFHSDFKYQAGIVGKYNHSNVPNLLCGAGIISDFFLISSIRCFLFTAFELRRLRFYAVIGLDVLLSKIEILYDIEQIYTHYYSENWDQHNLAIAKLEKSLDLQNRPDLDYLEIPHSFDIFNGQVGVVAGFGVSTVNQLQKYKRREQIRLTTNTSLALRYTNVTIINGMKNFYQHSSTTELICGEMSKFFTQLCGIILPDEIYEFRGVCRCDIGSPLVIDKKVVGIVSQHSKNCDDITHGTIYTKVSNYWFFIEELKRGILLHNTIIYENPVHIPTPKHHLRT